MLCQLPWCFCPPKDYTTATSLFIGSLPDAGASPRAISTEGAASVLQALGAKVAANGHQLVVCSLYPGSADLEILRSAARWKLTLQLHYLYG